MAIVADATQLRRGSLRFIECLGQSIANIAPTLTPALNITVVAGLAGTGAWLGYLVATIGMVFVALNIGGLARRHPQSGSYFLYIGRTFGPFAGMIAGWSMIGAYIFTAVAVLLGMVLFLGSALTALGLSALMPPAWLAVAVFTAVVGYAAYRDIRLSSRIGLVLEAVSVGIILVVMALVTWRHGTVIDPVQLDPSHISLGGVMASLTFAVFSFVGFESAATLAREAHEPEKAIPRAITGSAVIAGLFFVVIAYLMLLGTGDDVHAIADSASPFVEMTTRAGFAWAGAIVYAAALVSGFACALASVNAAARLVFSMGRFGVFSSRLGRVHATHFTPHVAVTSAAVLIGILTFALLPLGTLEAFGYAGTFATFGFLIVYLLICVVAPLDHRRAGALKPRHVVLGVIGTLLMTVVIVGSLYPVPDWPNNLLPYLFALYLGLGAAWFGMLRLRDPAVLATIEHDLEVSA